MEKEIAIFGAGCFWHVEYSFKNLPGIISTRVGYTGGEKKNPTYEEVSSGKTGHAESVEITFDSKKITYEQLLSNFWMIHDSTTLNKQGKDIGTNYRSVIFYMNEKQKRIAEESKKEFQKKIKKPIVTKIEKAETFYPAEEYHQKYFEKNGAESCIIKI